VAIAVPAPLAAQPAAPRPTSDLRPRWLLFELLAEVRVIFRMYFDRRYRLSWVGLVFPPVLLGLIALSYWWVPLSSLTLLPMKMIDLALAYVLFKVLSH